MLEAVGHPVRRLQRVGFGPLALGDLRPGGFRRLTPEEIEALRRASGS
jgi:23S rRNA pseudouridine2605 synthase